MSKSPVKVSPAWALLIASALAVGLVSCNQGSTPTATADQSDQTTSTAPPTASTGKLLVVTTFLPMTEFTKAVAGDRAQVTQLLPTTVGPHDYQAKPEDARLLAKANVLVENGLGMENFLASLIKSAGNLRLQVIDASKGIAPIATEDSEAHPDHGAEEKHAEADPAAVEHDHDHGAFNPHVWLDPKRAIQQVENIRDGLIAADPAGKDTYTANAAAYIAKLRQLDQEFAQKLKPFAGQSFVTYHDFAPYFAQSYNLKPEFLVGIPEENASPEDVKRVMTAVKASNLKTLLTEPQAAEGPFAALAKDLKVQVSRFDPLEAAGPEGTQPDHYLRVMRQNLTNLHNALAGQSTQSWLPRRWPSHPVALAFRPWAMRA